jgi:GT2 family glycosyltransferase
MNHDMKILPGWKQWLSMCFEYYEKIPNIGMVSPNLGPYYEPLDVGHMPQHEIFSDCETIQFGCCFMRRIVWDEVGNLLDYGRYRIWHSDKEWLNRLTLKGYCAAYIPCWVGHAGGVSVRELRKVDPIREDEE